MTEELIRKSDALAIVRPDGERDCDCTRCTCGDEVAVSLWDQAKRHSEAIAALPAVTVPVVSQPVRYCPICDIADCATHRPEPAPDPAAIREAALEEAAKVAERYTDCCQSCAGVGTRILALIAKGAAE